MVAPPAHFPLPESDPPAKSGDPAEPPKSLAPGSSLPPLPAFFDSPEIAGAASKSKGEAAASLDPILPPPASDLPPRTTPAPSPVLAPPLEFKKRKKSKAPIGLAAALLIFAAGAGAWFYPPARAFILAQTDRLKALVEEPTGGGMEDPDRETQPAPAEPSTIPAPEEAVSETPPPAPEPEEPAAEPVPEPEADPAQVAADDLSANRPAPPKAEENSLRDIVYEFDEDNSILKAPREALVNFLGAKNWKERLGHVQSPDRVGPLMEKYYQANPDGPVRTNTVTFQNSERVPGIDSMFFLFHITTDSMPEGFPVSVEETPQGMRIDWEAFVEFNDNLLFAFTNNYQEESARFHVIMRRAHYFGPGVPDLDNKFAFRIEPPIPGYHVYAFVDKDSPLVEKKLSYQLEWHAISYPIVELQWRRSPDGTQQYVEIKDILQNNWRAERTETQSAPATEGKAPEKQVVAGSEAS